MNYKSLAREIINEMVEEKNLRLYGFDWDDNILKMPTKIYLKNDKGSVVGMPTDDFAEYRHLIEKEPFELPKMDVIESDILNGQFEYNLLDYQSHGQIKAPLSN